jgi:DNA-binding transcriptional regulator LsrR (DeoR family)
MVHSQRLFTELLSLVGRTISVGTNSKADSLRGILKNVMFDSFIVDTDKGRRIIRFDDISYLDPVEEN